MPSQTGSIDLTAQVLANNNAKDYSDNVIDNLEIGGRNLLRNTNWNAETIKNFTTASVGSRMPGDYIGIWYKESNITLSFTENGYLNISTSATGGRYGIVQDVYLESGEYTLSASADDSGCVMAIGTSQWPSTNVLLITDKSRKSVSFEVETASNYRVYIYDNNADSSTIKNPSVNWVKLEKGNKATDWSPAPEDVDTNITNAAKTAVNYISADSTGIRIASASPSTQNQRLELTNSTLKMYDANNYQRLKLDSTNGVIIGKESYGHTQVTDTGLFIYDVNNKKRAQVDNNGLSVYLSDGTTSIANFGEVTRIGKAYVSGATDNESHMELDYHSLRLLDKQNKEYFFVSDLRTADGTGLFTEQFVGDGLRRSFTLSFQATSENYSVYTSNSSGGGYLARLTYVEFSNPPSAGTIIRASYYTTSAQLKAYTFGYERQGLIGPMSVAEGFHVTASGYASHAEGRNTTSEGSYAHSEGYGCIASGGDSHAEGGITTASGTFSHAEGSDTTASGMSSHAEGADTTASGYYSHSEGYGSASSGTYSHAEGLLTEASGDMSHAQNYGTVAGHDNQTAIGMYNDNDSANAFEIGNGTANDARSNALAVNWNGTIESGIARKGAIQWIDAARGTGAVYVPKKEGDMSNVVASLVMETSGGGAWIISNYADEYLRLSYVTGADRSAGNNTAVHPIVLNPDGSVTHRGDVGWTNLPLNSAVEAYSSGQTPQYRRVGQVVNLVGACKNKAQLAANGSLTLGTLPVGCRPHHDTVVLCQGSGQNKWCVAANASGTVIASRYSTGGTLVAAAAGTWIPFNITFLV